MTPNKPEVFFAFCHSSKHTVDWSRSENLSRWGKGEEVENTSYLRKQNASLLSMFTALSLCGHNVGTGTRASNDCYFICHTTWEVHLEITVSEWKLFPGKPAHGTQMKIQGCNFKMPLTTATVKSSDPPSLPPHCSFISPGHLPFLACINRGVERRTNNTFFPHTRLVSAWISSLIWFTVWPCKCSWQYKAKTLQGQNKRPEVGIEQHQYFQRLYQLKGICNSKL